MEALAPMIVMVTLILTTGGVLILRPIAKRLGGFLEASTQAKLRPSPDADLARIAEVLSSIDGRLNQLEERQDFAEALISASDPKVLSMPAPLRAPERN
ncbi:hypothetical protein [Longimicrobium sp.]|uniref:hypothetical protein n=1 Tax=Longimicrobium sp. TaxID=2029185 RepID=UPI002E32F540|nr:hypothetical protein [Longimicrobium sp.]HEX6039259.1 hypothetical protein [Longimicrobium sp.]